MQREKKFMILHNRVVVARYFICLTGECPICRDLFGEPQRVCISLRVFLLILTYICSEAASGDVQ